MTSRTLRFRLPFLAGAALGLAVSFTAIDAGLYVGQDTEVVMAEAQTVTAAELVAEHDCWTGDAPADMVGEIPGHVVVTIDGEPRYAGDRLVGRALEQLFDGVDHGLVVAGFCR